MKHLKRVAISLAVAGLAASLGMMAVVQLAYVPRDIVLQEPALHAETAMVLGASILPDGTPSDALRDRLLVGISLYKNKNVDRILLTGDDGAYHANEIVVMKRFAVAQGVPEADILIDGKGYRTYESCKHAAQSFKLKNILIVTQRFHMGRALYLCNRLGLNARGVTSDLQTYQKGTYFWLRDLAASVEAWWDINVRPPTSPVAS
jgi:vancomycin permeability regulator SanA